MWRKEAIAAEIPRLRRYARALAGSEGEADDLVQDCLARAIERIGQWREGESPRKWLFSILHNLFIDAQRRRVRRPLHVGLESLGVDQSSPAVDGASTRDIDRALRQLPEEQRQVILLVSLEGLSYAETAEVMQVPIGTVMSRLARVCGRLRSLMGLEEPDRTGTTSARSPLRRVK